jgi:hypothetical protein
MERTSKPNYSITGNILFCIFLFVCIFLFLVCLSPIVIVPHLGAVVTMNAVANTDGPQKSCCAQFCECVSWSWFLFKCPFFLVFFLLAAVLGLLGLVIGIVLLPLRCVVGVGSLLLLSMTATLKSKVSRKRNESRHYFSM